MCILPPHFKLLSYDITKRDWCWPNIDHDVVRTKHGIIRLFTTPCYKLLRIFLFADGRPLSAWSCLRFFSSPQSACSQGTLGFLTTMV